MRSIYFLIAIATCISSCNFQPKYQRPEMGLEESYRFSPENNVEYANLPWWEQLGDPVLNELIATALKNNQNLQVATATVLQFYAQYQVAFAQLLPQISAVNNNARTNVNSSIKHPLSFLYQLYMNLAYQFDFWGQIRNAVESAESTFLAQVDTRLNLILSIISAVAQGYVLLLQYDNQLAISKMTLDSRNELYRIAQLRYDAGLTSLMEWKQAEAQVQDAEAQIKIYEGLIPVQEDLIRVLLGAQPGPVPRGKMLDQLNLPPCIPAGLPSDLLENRPDILAAEKNLMAANAQIGVARAAFFPVIELTGIDGKQSPLMGYLLKNISAYSEWQIQATQPLYEGGALMGALSEAEAVFLENYHIYQQTVLVALQQVSDALVTYETTKETYAIQLQEIESDTEYRKLSELRYYNGLNDYLTVEIAEENLFVIQLAAEQTKGQIFSSLISLYTALGQGWDVDADYCSKCDNPYPLWKALFF